MTVLGHREFEQLVFTPCHGCRGQFLRAFALLPGTLTVSSGEPVSSVRWGYERDDIHDLVYRVQCVDCQAVIYQSDDCPKCGAVSALTRVCERQNGVKPPPNCPHCDYEDLSVKAQILAYHEYLHGHFSRRVCLAEPHEPGFHVYQIDCLNCQEPVASSGHPCVACGRSSLLKKIR